MQILVHHKQEILAAGLVPCQCQFVSVDHLKIGEVILNYDCLGAQLAKATSLLPP